MDKYVNEIIKLAKKAAKNHDVPIGAIIIKDNKIIAKAYNNREKNHDITGHAEVNVIKKAAKKLKRWNLSDCSLFVTLFPCSMCQSVIKQSKLKNVYYLCDKLSFKKEYSNTEFHQMKDDVKNAEYKEILSTFFRDKR